MKLKITLAALFISGALIAQDKITREFSDIDRITMSTGSADCIVKKSSGNKITVEVIHYYGDDYKPTIEKEGNALRIKEPRNNRSGWSWSGDRSPKWTLTIPDNIRLKYNTGSGDFMASDLKLEIDLNAGSGDIIVDNMSGELVSNNGSGDMELDGFDGDLRANTGSGDINISQAKGDLSINCGSGEISIRGVQGAISANVGSGDIDARDVIVDASSDFNSGSGDVDIELASSPKADLSVNSGSGDANLDYNGNDIQGMVVMKANKRNGDIRAPFDFDTSEEIDNYHQTIIKKTKKMDNTKVSIKVGTGSGVARISQ